MQQQLTVPPQTDQVSQPTLPHPLSHRHASKHQGFDTKETSLAGQINLKPAIECALIEQDRLLRQPLQRSLGRYHQSRSHPGWCIRSQSSIKPLRRLRRNRRLGAETNLDRHLQAVPSGDTTTCVQHHHVHPARTDPSGKPSFQAANLTQFVKHGLRPKPLDCNAQFPHRALQLAGPRPTDAAVHPPRRDLPDGRPGPRHPDPSPPSSGQVPEQNRNIVPLAGWPCLLLLEAARSPVRYP